MIETPALEKLNKQLNEIGKELYNQVDKLPAGITQELAIGANDIRNTIIKSMRDTPKTGRVYRRGKIVHVASSPGNPPAIDTGELIRSVMFDVRDMEIEIGSLGGAPYSKHLEFGTKKMEARPFVNPAVEKHEDEIVDRVGKKAFNIIKKPFEDM